MKRSLLVLSILLYSISSIQATIFYVDAARANNSGAGTSWASAKRDLQAAIIAAAAGDEIWVKAGTYLPTHDPFGNASPGDNRDKTFLLKQGVKIYAGFAGTETMLSQRNHRINIATLSGDLGTAGTVSDNAYHVVMTVNLSNTSLLDGFVITGGYATAGSSSMITVGGRTIERYKGAGVFNANSATVFTNCIIKTNGADCLDDSGDSWGAGMVINDGSSVLTDCVFDANYFLENGRGFGVFGTGMIINGGSNSLVRCVFANHTPGSGFWTGSRGGAVHLNGTASFTNCIFYNNRATGGGAIAAGSAEFNNSSFTNCTFANNTSDYVGTAFLGFADATFTNCIFWNNNPTINGQPGRNEIYSEETRTQYQPTFVNCIVRDAAGSPLAITNTWTTSLSNANPQFVNIADGDGPDNKWGTADDGLRIVCASPAINAGTGASPATDFLDVTRTSPLDIGAYEGGYTNVSTGTLASVQTTITLSPASGVNHAATCTNLVASLQSGGTYTVAGPTAVKVWIQGVQPTGYVRRHYEITPASNAATATGRVTLYFTQADFNAFNSQVPAPALRLPQTPTDGIGKANLLIEKKSGTSSNNTGLPNTYSGSRSNINPADADIVWNAGSSRWEVSFDVAGFSGFFVKTSAVLLPLDLVSFTGEKRFECNVLQWKTENETNTRRFEIERSSDGTRFEKIGVISASGNGDHSYKFDDCNNPSGKLFYRLRMIDMDETYTYSGIVTISDFISSRAEVYPNPATEEITIRIADRSLLNTTARIIGLNGIQVMNIRITDATQQVNIGQLPAGIYMLELADGTQTKLVKTGK